MPELQASVAVEATPKTQSPQEGLLFVAEVFGLAFVVVVVMIVLAKITHEWVLSPKSKVCPRCGHKHLA